MKTNVCLILPLFLAVTGFEFPCIRDGSNQSGTVAKGKDLKTPRTVAEIVGMLNECPSVQSVGVPVGPTSWQSLLPLEERLRTEEQVFYCMKALATVDRNVLLRTAQWVVATGHPGPEQCSFQNAQGKSRYVATGVFVEHRREDLTLKFAMLTRYLFTCPVDNYNPWRQTGNRLAFTARGFVGKMNALNINPEADFVDISCKYPLRDFSVIEPVIAHRQ